MELPRKHHYKPVFFLSRWAGKDGQLCEMKLIKDKGKIVPRRRHPAGTGYVKDLYRTDGVPEEISQILETNFMSPLDNDAANALNKIASDQPLDADERIAWARFMLSLLYRNREGVEFIKAHMADIRREATLALEPDWAAQRGALDAPTLAEASAAREPAAAAKSAANMLADIIANSRAVPDIAAMHWTRIDLRGSKVPLLTSDRPLAFVGLSDPRAYMALPMGPYDLFVAARDDRFSKPRTDATEIARRMNTDVVSLGRRFVWGVDDAQLDFVRTWIGAAPDRVILTEAQRQNILAIGRGLQPADGL
ncbi:Protein of unknown function [Bradyrhizobium erythrophlei]|nr:Protein of unknown function [Bradyrhizobium erythrophlei]